jgi:predicted dehydrogenase
MPPLRFGVAGLGFGSAVHLPALLAMPDVRVAAIAGRRPDAARAVAARFGIAEVAGSWESLLDHDLDAVTFALPPDENERACEAALRKGVAVLSEKPLAASAAAAARLKGLAAGTTNGVDFQFAELEAFRRFASVIHSRELGAVRRVQVTWLLESYAQRSRVWSWKTDRQRSGGVTTLLGSHLFYLAEWLFGEIGELTSRTSMEATAGFAPHGGEPADDTVDLWALHASGTMLSATYGNAAPAGPGHRWECVCDEGTITLHNPSSDYMAGFELTVRTRTGTSVEFRDAPAPNVDGRLAPFARLASRFVAAVKARGAMQPDFAAAARVQELMERVVSPPTHARP